MTLNSIQGASPVSMPTLGRSQESTVERTVAETLCHKILLHQEPMSPKSLTNKNYSSLACDDPARPILCLRLYWYEEPPKRMDIESVKQCFKEFVECFTKYFENEKENNTQLALTESLLKDFYQITVEDDQLFPRVKAIVDLYRALSVDLTMAFAILQKMLSPTFNRVALLRTQIGTKIPLEPRHLIIRTSRSESSIETANHDDEINNEFGRGENASAIRASRSEPSIETVKPAEVNARLKRRGSARNVSRWDKTKYEQFTSSNSSSDSMASENNNAPITTSSSGGWGSCNLI